VLCLFTEGKKVSPEFILSLAEEIKSTSNGKYRNDFRKAPVEVEPLRAKDCASFRIIGPRTG
jgi:hypothetical protein